MSNRIIKSISFNNENPYEIDLHNFAIEQGKYFGRYIKRLIDRDKREREHGMIAPDTSFYSTPDEIRESDQDSDAASRFL